MLRQLMHSGVVRAGVLAGGVALVALAGCTKSDGGGVDAGSGSGVDGGTNGNGNGSGDNPCAIPSEDLQVDFPYETTSPPTVVTVSGTCIQNEYEGYSSAEATAVIEDATANLEVVELGGGYFTLDFEIEQRDLSSAERSDLAATTGIPVAELEGQAQILRINEQNLAFDGYTPPSGVSVDSFLGTQLNTTGYIRFSSQSEADLEQVIDDLSSAAHLTITVGRLSGGGTYLYTFELQSQSPYVTVLDVSTIDPRRQHGHAR